MPYTLTMSLLWLVFAAVAGVVVGYLFRGRTSVITTGDHPADRDAARAATEQEVELDQLRQQVERLETQLSITVAERDRLRQQLESADPVAVQAGDGPAGDKPAGDKPAGDGPAGDGPAGDGPAGAAS